MALVYNRFSIYRLFAAYQPVARFHAGFTEGDRRRPERRAPSATNDLRDSERYSSWSRQSASQHLPGSAFDARYRGLTADAGRLDAAICRQERLR
jgi:hypothetical protein